MPRRQAKTCAHGIIDAGSTALSGQAGPRGLLASKKFVEEHRPVVPNNRSVDTSVVVLVEEDPTAARKEDELRKERGVVSILVAFAASAPAAWRGSVCEGARGHHAAALPERTAACRPRRRLYRIVPVLPGGFNLVR